MEAFLSFSRQGGKGSCVLLGAVVGRGAILPKKTNAKASFKFTMRPQS